MTRKNCFEMRKGLKQTDRAKMRERKREREKRTEREGTNKREKIRRKGCENIFQFNRSVL